MSRDLAPMEYTVHIGETLQVWDRNGWKGTWSTEVTLYQATWAVGMRRAKLMVRFAEEAAIRFSWLIEQDITIYKSRNLFYHPATYTMRIEHKTSMQRLL